MLIETLCCTWTPRHQNVFFDGVVWKRRGGHRCIFGKKRYRTLSCPKLHVSSTITQVYSTLCKLCAANAIQLIFHFGDGGQCNRYVYSSGTHCAYLLQSTCMQNPCRFSNKQTQYNFLAVKWSTFMRHRPWAALSKIHATENTRTTIYELLNSNLNLINLRLSLLSALVLLRPEQLKRSSRSVLVFPLRKVNR